MRVGASALNTHITPYRHGNGEVLPTPWPSWTGCVLRWLALAGTRCARRRRRARLGRVTGLLSQLVSESQIHSFIHSPRSMPSSVSGESRCRSDSLHPTAVQCSLRWRSSCTPSAVLAAGAAAVVLTALLPLQCSVHCCASLPALLVQSSLLVQPLSTRQPRSHPSAVFTAVVIFLHA